MSPSHDEHSASSRPRSRAIPPEEPAEVEAGPKVSVRDKLLRLLPFAASWSESRRENVWVLASVLALSLAMAFAVLLAFSGYELISEYLASDAEEIALPLEPPSTELSAEDASREYEKAKREAEQARREAQQALEEAERERQLNVARMQADKYEWSTWQQTLHDIDDNNKRLKEKQQAAQAKEEEAQRLARVEEQKRLQEIHRKAAEMAPAAKAAARAKKRIRNFD
jgi:hypothetical protein